MLYERTLDENLWNKYETHLRVFDLDATFSSKACEEMEDCKCPYKRLLENVTSYKILGNGSFPIGIC